MGICCRSWRAELSGTNFGPTLSVAEIRRHCPNAVIDGQLAPFTYSRNEEAEHGGRVPPRLRAGRRNPGTALQATAGSINNGSRLTGMRLLMAAVQRHGRYDG
jgi:uroporphyrinogen decarboxylase